MSMNKKIFSLVLVILVLLVPVSNVFASSYEYIIDNANIFDDSYYMIQQAKNLRSKLDLEIHIYSVDEITEADSIFEEYIQNSSALILVISKNGEIEWYTGSVTKKIIRDVDMEEIIDSNQFSDKQYTTYINNILYDITVFSIGEENVVIDSENTIAVTEKNSIEEKFSWIPYVSGFLLGFIFIFSFIFSIKKIKNKIQKKIKEKEKEKIEEEKLEKHIMETPLEDLAREEYEKIKEKDENIYRRNTSKETELEKLKKKYDSNDKIITRK